MQIFSIQVALNHIRTLSQRRQLFKTVNDWFSPFHLHHLLVSHWICPRFGFFWKRTWRCNLYILARWLGRAWDYVIFCEAWLLFTHQCGMRCVPWSRMKQAGLNGEGRGQVWGERKWHRFQSSGDWIHLQMPPGVKEHSPGLWKRKQTYADLCNI